MSWWNDVFVYLVESLLGVSENGSWAYANCNKTSNLVAQHPQNQKRLAKLTIIFPIHLAIWKKYNELTSWPHWNDGEVDSGKKIHTWPNFSGWWIITTLGYPQKDRKVLHHYFSILVGFYCSILLGVTMSRWLLFCPRKKTQLEHILLRPVAWAALILRFRNAGSRPINFGIHALMRIVPMGYHDISWRFSGSTFSKYNIYI